MCDIVKTRLTQFYSFYVLPLEERCNAIYLQALSLCLRSWYRLTTTSYSLIKQMFLMNFGTRDSRLPVGKSRAIPFRFNPVPDPEFGKNPGLPAGRAARAANPTSDGGRVREHDGRRVDTLHATWRVTSRFVTCNVTGRAREFRMITD